MGQWHSLGFEFMYKTLENWNYFTKIGYSSPKCEYIAVQNMNI